MFLVDLGSHSLKIGTMQDERSSNDSNELFHVSHNLSQSAVDICSASESKHAMCDEIPTLIGRPKITSLSQLYLNSTDLEKQVRYGLDCFRQSDLLSIQPIIQS